MLKFLRPLLFLGVCAAACGETVTLNNEPPEGEGGAPDEVGGARNTGGEAGTDAGPTAGSPMEGGADAGGTGAVGNPGSGGDAGSGLSGGGGSPSAGAAGAGTIGGAPATPNPSCIGEVGSNDEYCSRLVVPGGTFARNYDGIYFMDDDLVATVSSFYLEQYEVSVGRYRAFAAAGWSSQQDPPPVGAGAHPKLASSGWKAAWNTQLADNRSAAISAVQCDARSSVKNDHGFELFPVPCVNWYEAFAFCAWSGGRLPTLAEWNYAAAGGDEQRVYPWSTPPSSTDIGNVRAVYASNTSAIAGNPPFVEVSGKPAGAGRWGHYNLAGNLAEWVLDQEGDPPVPCNDCALLDVGGVRLTAGGGWADNAENVLASAHLGSTPSNRSILVGFRCAFDE